MWSLYVVTAVLLLASCCFMPITCTTANCTNEYGLCIGRENGGPPEFLRALCEKCTNDEVIRWKVDNLDQVMDGEDVESFMSLLICKAYKLMGLARDIRASMTPVCSS